MRVQEFGVPMAHLRLGSPGSKPAITVQTLKIQYHKQIWLGQWAGVREPSHLLSNTFVRAGELRFV